MRFVRRLIRLGFRLVGNALLGILLLVGLIAAAVGYVWYTLPPVAELKDRFPVVTVQKKGEPVKVTIEAKRPPGWTSLGEIPRAVVGAVVVSEDGTFFKHDGYDTDALKAAIKEDLERKSFAFGGSTITQQVVKNVYLHKQKSLLRKAKEFYLAVQLDKAADKKRILEIYFNIVELGDGIYGIRQAARHYFQKAPGELTPKDGAFIAMLLPSPKKYSVSYRKQELTRFAQRTINSLLTRMAQAGYITAEERDLWKGTPLSFERAALAEPAPIGDGTQAAPTEESSSEDETVVDDESVENE